MNQVAVIGLGRFGFSLAQTLAKNRCQVLAIDSDMDNVKKVQGLVTQAVQLDARDEDALKAIGVADMDIAVVAIGTDVEASMLATMILKELGVPKVIAKAVNELHGRFLTKIGADKVIYPEMDTGRRLGKQLANPSIVEQIELGEDYGVFELNLPSAWEGKSIRDVDIRVKYGITVVAIRSAPQGEDKFPETNVSPQATTVFRKGDVLVLLGSNEDIRKVSEKHKLAGKKF